MTSTHDIVRLKITLDNVKPTVMRRIEVPVSVKLDTLHEMIQAIMPWDNYHGYDFRVRETFWGDSHAGNGRLRLSDCRRTEGDARAGTKRTQFQDLALYLRIQATIGGTPSK